MNVIEINEPIIETVFNDIKENEIFIIPRYQKEGKVFMKINTCLVCVKDDTKQYKHCNAICLNDGSFTHCDYDEFVIPCKSELRVRKTYKEESK